MKCKNYTFVTAEKLSFGWSSVF